MNGGPVGSRVADSLDQLGLSGWDGIKKTFPEATLRFFRKPGEPFAADPLGLESFELAYRLLAAKINDCECADRKSTRLNSSHTVISYAVFCLKKKSRKD